MDSFVPSSDSAGSKFLEDGKLVSAGQPFSDLGALCDVLRLFSGRVSEVGASIGTSSKMADKIWGAVAGESEPLELASEESASLTFS